MDEQSTACFVAACRPFQHAGALSESTIRLLKKAAAGDHDDAPAVGQIIDAIRQAEGSLRLEHRRAVASTPISRLRASSAATRR